MGRTQTHGPEDSSLRDLPFDQYSRHMLVQRVAAHVRGALQTSRLNVLDVGGYPGLAPRFLPDDHVIVTDIVAGEAPGVAYLRADGAALPFPDQALISSSR